MTIYVGRWDLISGCYEAYNGLINKTEKEIIEEIGREVDLFYERNGYEDNFIAVYSAAEFEDTFNQTLTGHISSEDYWVRIFAD